MFIEFDTDKRTKTLAERGLDFARAGDVFADKLDARRCAGKLRRGSSYYFHEESQ